MAERAFESSPRIIITGDLNVNLLIENDHRLNQIINIFNLTNCIREPTRLGALLDPILFSDELETTFSDVIQVDRIKSDHDATIAFFPIPYDLQTNYEEMTRMPFQLKCEGFPRSYLLHQGTYKQHIQEF
jgi:hypothetical protein